MLRAAGYLIRDQDPRLVVMAVLLSLMAAGIGLRLLDPRRVGVGQRSRIRLGAAIAVFSTGLWSADFIGLAALRPDLPFALDGLNAVLSLAIWIGATTVSFLIWPGAHGSPARVAGSGLVLALGASAAQLMGTIPVVIAAGFHQQIGPGLAALGLTAFSAMIAMSLASRRRIGWAAMVLALGLGVGRSVAMASLGFDGAGGMPWISRLVMALVVGGADVLVTGLAVAAVVVDQRVAEWLAKEAGRFRMLADATLDGLIFERHGQIIGVNRALCDLVAADAKTLVGRPLAELIPGTGLRLSERGDPGEHTMRRPDGRTVPVELSWQTGPDPGGRVVAVRDVSRQKAAERRLEQLARLDPLTGLVNREMFEQELGRGLADPAATLAIYYIELDRFELINDTIGYRAGEQILVQAAQRLTALIQQSGLIQQTGVVARLGRAAFGIILPLTKPSADPAAMADRILCEMALPFLFDEQPVVLTASIGVAAHPQDDKDARDLVDCAMLALCQAKRDGYGRWCRFQPDTDSLVHKKRSLANDLRTALKQDQFCLHYQPFVDTTTLEIAGYEALVRWDHPERGRISPADFIPMAEESGLIVPIGSWVLATACAEAAAWTDPVIISVNLSPAQFIQPGIVENVAWVLRQTGLPPSRLELEITEGTLMDDTQNALRILTSLKALGVKIAMDDFGTGYSSLSYLRKFPFDKLKIDRSFISDAEESADAETIVQAIIGMSRSLRLTVTAEGIETTRQLEMLRTMGCDFVQGYLLGRPRGAEHLNRRAATPLQPAVAEPRMVAAAVSH